MPRRIAALLLLLSGAARAASPHLAGFNPPGIQRGADTDIVISGDRLEDARGMLFYSPGLQILSIKPDNGSQVHARLRAAPDCPLGEHDVRVWTATGISELFPLYVGPFPNVASTGTNHVVLHPQPVPVNSTVNGLIRDEQIDYYSIQAKKGDRITAEVEGMRLGYEMFDPWAAILDANGRELASDDDCSLFLQDPLVSTIAPADGTYLVAVRESTWGGSGRSFYRLHIGNYPQPVVVYPSGGPAGQKLAVTFLGDVKGPIPATVQLPTDPALPFATPVPLAPAPLSMRVSPFPNVLKKTPDFDAAHATAGPPPPVAFNGIIDHPGDCDFFRFHAKAGADLYMTVYARQLRSPLDSVLDLWDAKGNHISGNDDSIGPDSFLEFNVPSDGDYCISVHDQLNRGGPTFVYRVEVVPVTPSVAFTVPEVVRDTQERETVVVPRGNRYATMLRAKRQAVDGGFQVSFPGLLPGVTVQTGSFAGDVMPVVFQAAPDAAVSATLTDVIATPAGAAKPIPGGYAQTVTLMIGPPNQYPYLTTNINRLAVSVADEAPFSLDLQPPPAPIQQDGQLSLHVTAIRKPGFTGPINVSMLYNPPGLNSETVVTIPDKQNSADLPLNANGDAKTKTWQVAVIGSADIGQGAVWISSALEPLTVSQPFVSGQIDRASATQGQPTEITCHFAQNLPFDGKAHVRLMGLPDRVTAPDLDITSKDSQAVFKVTTDPKSPSGPHRDLFCQVTVVKGGISMVANTAWGGTLRIDRLSPTPAPKQVAAVSRPAPAVPPPGPKSAAAAAPAASATPAREVAAK